jgi:hypothetical protein
MASGVGLLKMRYVDHVAKETSLGLGTMFIFAPFLHLVTWYFACQLPKYRRNSKNLERHEHLTEKVDEELAEPFGFWKLLAQKKKVVAPAEHRRKDT